jgi:hypothetical protein
MASDVGVNLEPRDLAPCSYFPQPDRFVPVARAEAPVRQHAKHGDRPGVPPEATGFGAARQVPQPDRVIPAARY